MLIPSFERTCHRQLKTTYQRIFGEIKITRPAWAGFKTAEEGKAIIKSCIL